METRPTAPRRPPCGSSNCSAIPMCDCSTAVATDGETIVYCRVGERAAHTWFVLTALLGYDRVRNYDGSWTEWSNSVRTPMVKGAEPGVAVAPPGPAAIPAM